MGMSRCGEPFSLPDGCPAGKTIPLRPAPVCPVGLKHALPFRYSMQTILVIDDDENLRDTIAVMLEQEGFRAVMTGDGKSGFEKAVMLKPDLMLVDLRLPGMSGVEICKQLRASQVKTPIIVLSAMGDEVDKVLLLEIGA